MYFKIMGNIIRIITILLFLTISNSFGQLDYSQHVGPIYEGKESTALSVYDTDPESPDGKNICFIKYPGIAKGGHLAKPVPASVMIKNRATGKIRKIYDVKCNNHNGANALWVNDSIVAFQLSDFKNFVIYNIKTDQVVLGPI